MTGQKEEIRVRIEADAPGAEVFDTLLHYEPPTTETMVFVQRIAKSQNRNYDRDDPHARGCDNGPTGSVVTCRHIRKYDPTINVQALHQAPAH